MSPFKLGSKSLEPKAPWHAGSNSAQVFDNLKFLFIKYLRHLKQWGYTIGSKTSCRGLIPVFFPNLLQERAIKIVSFEEPLHSSKNNRLRDSEIKTIKSNKQNKKN